MSFKAEWYFSNWIKDLNFFEGLERLCSWLDDMYYYVLTLYTNHTPYLGQNGYLMCKHAYSRPSINLRTLRPYKYFLNWSIPYIYCPVRENTGKRVFPCTMLSIGDLWLGVSDLGVSTHPDTPILIHQPFPYPISNNDRCSHFPNQNCHQRIRCPVR